MSYAHWSQFELDSIIELLETVFSISGMCGWRWCGRSGQFSWLGRELPDYAKDLFAASPTETQPPSPEEARVVAFLESLTADTLAPLAVRCSSGAFFLRPTNLRNEATGIVVCGLAHGDLQASIGELNQATRESIIAEIVHRTNQPLFAIMNFAKAASNALAREPFDVAQIREWNEEIANAAACAGDLIRDLRHAASHAQVE